MKGSGCLHGFLLREDDFDAVGGAHPTKQSGPMNIPEKDVIADDVVGKSGWAGGWWIGTCDWLRKDASNEVKALNAGAESGRVPRDEQVAQR